ncbi:MAG: hypothetical protein AB1714_06140 [Acidobacteriota bacterium]
MTLASQQALIGLRDLSTLQWYVIPLLALVLYVYATEIKRARISGDWNSVFAGLTLFGMDCVNETWNGWVLVLTGRSACWTAPGPTALRTMVGWNIEIMFMFAIAGIVFYHTLGEDRRHKILGLPEPWFWAVVYSAFCVLVEVLLNIGGLLVWEYAFWNRSLGGVWLIFLLGYFIFFAAVILVTGMRSNRGKLLVIGTIYGVAVMMNILGMGAFGWVY